MSRTQWLKIVNILLGANMLTQMVSGFGMDAFNNEHLTQSIHVHGGMLLVVLAIAHTALNWGWVRSVFGAKKKAA